MKVSVGSTSRKWLDIADPHALYLWTPSQRIRLRHLVVGLPHRVLVKTDTAGFQSSLLEGLDVVMGAENMPVCRYSLTVADAEPT